MRVDKFTKHIGIPTMLNFSKTKLSLRQVLIVPYMVLVVVLSLTIVSLSYKTGSDAVETVADSLLAEAGSRIGLAVDRHIIGSAAVLEAAFPDGMKASELKSEDLNGLRERFWIATSLHTDPNNYVYYGNTQGQFFGVSRKEGIEAELRMKLDSQEPRKFYRFEGIRGEAVLTTVETKPYDPRLRPWFKAGQSEQAQIWTSVYIDFSSGDLVATRARRVWGDNNDLAGVVATDVKLRALNDFVSSLKISKNGIALILEGNGDLIASSISSNVKVLPDNSKARVNAADSDNAMVKELYQQVKELIKFDAKDKRPRVISFEGADGKVIHAAIHQLVDKAGLSWVAVVAMPRSDYIGDVTNNLIKTAFLTALAALIVIALGTRILQWVMKDLKHLSDAASKVGEGQFDWQVGASKSIEIGRLASSFEAMQKRLMTDELTGLANRDAFLLRLRRRVKQAAENHGRRQAIPDKFAVLFIDLNQFKRVNDTLGHSVGDRVLIETGQRLIEQTTSRDMVARLAGDEFVVLLDAVMDLEQLDLQRKRIFNALQAPYACLSDTELADNSFGGSVGQAVFPEDGFNASGLLKRADRRMYRQKFSRRSDDVKPRARDSYSSNV